MQAVLLKSVKSVLHQFDICAIKGSYTVSV